jgi:hypothetical protein
MRTAVTGFRSHGEPVDKYIKHQGRLAIAAADGLRMKLWHRHTQRSFVTCFPPAWEKENGKKEGKTFHAFQGRRSNSLSCINIRRIIPASNRKISAG